MTEKPVHNRAGLRSPPATDGSREVTIPCGLEAPCHQQQGAFLLEQVEQTLASAWPSSEEFDAQEAARNFEAFLSILREWDEEERTNACRQKG